MTVQRGPAPDRGSHIGRVCGAKSMLRKDVPQSVSGRTGSSGSDPFVQVRFVWLSPEAAFSVRLRGTDADGQSRTIAQNERRISLSVSLEGGMKRVLEVRD